MPTDIDELTHKRPRQCGRRVRVHRGDIVHADAYDAGCKAFDAGTQLDDCRYKPGEHRDLWCMGFRDRREQAGEDERAAEARERFANRERTFERTS